jgi:anti-sigma B factor antagonist
VKLAITTEARGSDEYIIALSGELDLYTCPEFKQELLGVIGRGVLQRGVERLRGVDGRLSVACGDPHICKVFEVTGLDRIFTVYRSREEALGQVPSS